jgi:glyoxylase-like metal-dependent hydrolase (beta-lactamase superfamily II)
MGRAVGRSPPGPIFLWFRLVFGVELEPALAAEGVVRLGTDLCNWFLLDSDGRVVVVDAGLPAYRPQLERGLAMLGRGTADVEAVVVTHDHIDHTGTAGTLCRELGVPVYLHAAERKTAAERSKLPYLRRRPAWVFLTHLKTSGRPERPSRIERFEDGAELPGGLRAIHTGGHTPGHCVFVHAARGLLFAGDLICTRNPLTGGPGPGLMPAALNLSSGTMLDSLTRLESLEVGTILFGHGEPWTQGAAAAVRRAREIGLT